MRTYHLDHPIFKTVILDRGTPSEYRSRTRQEEEAKSAAVQYLSYIGTALPGLEAYVTAFGQKHRVRGVRMLDAHGDSVEGEFYWFDGKRKRRVQQWIGNHDGNYALLVLLTCNPGSQTVSAQRSLISVPTHEVSPAAGGIAGTAIELYDPEVGYVDSNTIDARLTELQQGRSRKTLTDDHLEAEIGGWVRRLSQFIPRD